jgi:GDP/UDP-N,N'-diacetylbacillosamine 2-epimerase (hydrolysing)
MNRKICVVTGTRAEYGLLHWVMKGIQQASDLELQIIATGMHLSPEFGLTYQEIEKDGFHIDHKVEMLLSSDTPSGLAKSMGLGLIGMGDVLKELQPDIMMVLGDRFELLSAVVAAMVARIPVAHLHGGESTEGAFDEAIRHSITKMSYLHFVAADEYQKRVVQLGEHPDRVFLVGGLGIDNIKKLDLLDRSSLESSLDFKFGPKNLLVTFHSVTLENETSAKQIIELLAALRALDDTHLIFTMPNADTHSRLIADMIKQFVTDHPNARAYTSLGQLRYLSCIKFVDGVVGNSSSGLIEVPSFAVGTINIGDRQRGRLKAESVIDCDPNRQSIADALKYLYSDTFRKKLEYVHNPYGQGGASERVVETLKKVKLDDGLKKCFFDLPIN